MRNFHNFHANNPLDFLIVRDYIFYQTLGQMTRGPASIVWRAIRGGYHMPVHGHTIAWGTHIGRSTRDARVPWFQRLRQWLTGRPVGSLVAVPASLHRGWDGRHERFRPPA